MKNLTPILHFICSALSIIHAKDYSPLVVEGARWNVYYEASCVEWEYQIKNLQTFSIDGDTAFNDTSYKKLYLKTSNVNSVNVQLAGYLREKDKKVYFKVEEFQAAAPKDMEVLLYNFNAKVGDTITYHDYFFSQVVIATDSMEINKTFRDYYVTDFEYMGSNDTMVEGIGSIKQGLLGHINDIPTCGGHFWELMCYGIGDSTIYTNPKYSSCNVLPNDLTETAYKPSITFFPNPVNNTLHIQTNSSFGGIIEIVNASGITMRRITAGSQHLSINFTYPGGIYFVRLLNNKGAVVKTYKVLKF